MIITRTGTGLEYGDSYACQSINIERKEVNSERGWVEIEIVSVRLGVSLGMSCDEAREFARDLMRIAR